MFIPTSRGFPVAKRIFDARGGAQKVQLFFSARNGHWVQLLHLVRVGDQVLYATRVTKGLSPGIKIYEKVDEHFPKEVLEQDRHWLKG